LSQIKIHPNFKLAGVSFSDASVLLSFVKKNYPRSYTFLKDFFTESDFVIVNTSGSTGKPKNIKIKKKAMLSSAESTGQFFDLPAKTKALHCLSSDFIAGKLMWVRAIHLGWHIDVVAPTSTPLASISNSYDFAAMVPLQVQNSLQDLHSIKTLIIGGAPISYTLGKAIQQLKTKCFQTYGMTETITHIAIKNLNNLKDEHYHCLPKVKVSVDSKSCLIIQVAYISDELIKTNDVVRLISDSEFQWIGRFDNVINSAGIKLYPEQIEAKLASIISKPFIIGSIPDDIFGEKLVLLIENEQEIPDLSTLILHTALSKYEIPKKIFYLSKFCRTQNNKINRKDTFSIIDK
jgi:O-succinylbenzoic acid--CoA ligase